MSGIDTSTIEVWKFGGSSFLTAGAYGQVSEIIARRTQMGKKLCVVVSAMSGTTGRLSELLDAITPNHTNEDRDAVLGTGEILAAALLRAALTRAGVKTKSLNAFQLGWEATDRFADGVLIHSPNDELNRALNTHSVVVVAGGQALSNERLVMLGRNSSDLTAIAVAASLDLQEATIFSDIEGVCSADPYLIDSAVMMARLHYDQAARFAQAGAKILFERSITLAKEKGVEIQCAALLKDGTVRYGTRVGAVGRGVQVSLPKGAHILHAIPEGIDQADRGVIIPVQGETDKYILCGDALNSVDDTAPICHDTKQQTTVVTIDPNGRFRGYLFEDSMALEYAHKLHDALLKTISGDKNFQPLRNLPKKKRGVYTSVYSSFHKTVAS